MKIPITRQDLVLVQNVALDNEYPFFAVLPEDYPDWFVFDTDDLMLDTCMHQIPDRLLNSAVINRDWADTVMWYAG